MRPRCVFVIGPESSGSMLIAKTLSAALGIDAFGQWNGEGWSTSSGTPRPDGTPGDRLCHRSLPYDLHPARWPDIDAWITEYADSHDVRFVLCTNDIFLSEQSRIDRFGKTVAECEQETARARDMILDVRSRDVPSMIWSYETFMLLDKSYLDDLYAFIGIQSDFMPTLRDANRKRLTGKIARRRRPSQLLRASHDNFGAGLAVGHKLGHPANNHAGRVGGRASIDPHPHTGKAHPQGSRSIDLPSRARRLKAPHPAG